jgi:hypothetical protein
VVDVSYPPLLLLPYRLETRFVDAAEQYVTSGYMGPALLLRICPDQISIDSFDPRLTVAEKSAGATFWSDYQSALANNGDPKGPWSTLVATYGAPRAAYLVQVCNPQYTGAPPGSRPSAWELPPVILGLPDYWILECDDGAGTAVRVATSAVKSNLAIGPDPNSTTATTINPAQMPLGDEIRWMADFNQALSVGMAACIPLTAAQRSQGFKQIFAYGVRTSDDGTNTLTTLLRHHRFTDGLAFDAQGTATKNTLDASSGVSSSDPGSNASYAALFPQSGQPLTTDLAVQGPAAAPLTPPAPPPPPGGPYTAWTDGRRAAFLLGIDPVANFGNVPGADGRDQQDAIDMAIALWPATMGYFIRDMMAGSIPYPSRAAFEQWLQGLFVSYVRACGFLPALRVGSTPYGIAVTADWERYEVFAPGAAAEPSVVAFLRKAYQLWQQSQAAVPTVVASSANADNAFAAAMAADAASVSYSKQWVLGPSFWESTLYWLGLTFPQVQAWQAERAATVRTTCATYGIPEPDPMVGFAIDFGAPFDSGMPLVQSDPLSTTDPLTNNYISWLATQPITAIQNQNFPGGNVPNALLYLLLRQSMLRAYVGLATDNQLSSSTIAEPDAIEQEMVNVAQPSKTPWTILDTAINNTAGAPTFRNYLYGIAQNALTNPSTDPTYAGLNQLIVSLSNLAVRPSATIDRLARETLDLFSYRLDAWINYLAHKTLVVQRNRQIPGVTIGGYSWVENVAPDTSRVPLQSPDEIAATQALDAALSAAGVPTPAIVQPTLDSGGFIHAPSNAQAATAAILRSGYLSHKGTANGALLNIDLSSERVSRALWLLEGVRQGQSLGALLGYQFEQQLIANGFGADVLPFRNAYPLITGKLSPVQTSADAEGGPNVVDGNALLQAWQAGTLLAGLPVSDALPYLQQLQDLLDALSDLGIAEAVFQIVRGNPEHSGAIMNAIAQGANPPPVQVCNTPRGGFDLTHRVAILFASQPTLANHWLGTGARAQLDPWLNAWVSGQLPDATAVKIRVIPVAPAGGPAPAPFTIQLSDLNLSALDVLALGDADDSPQLGELELRLLAASAANVTIPAGSPAPTLAYTDPTFTATDMTLPQFMAAARTVRDLVSHARGLKPDDLSLPSGKERGLDATAIDLGEMADRVSACVAATQTAQSTLQTAADALRTAIVGGAATATQVALAATLRGAMMAAGGLALGASVPRWPDATDLATENNALLARADIGAATLRSRLSKILSAPSALTATAVAAAGGSTSLTIGFTVGGVTPPAVVWSPSAKPTDLLTKLPNSIVDQPRLAAATDTVTLSGLPVGAWPTTAASYLINTVAAVKAVIDPVEGTVTLTVPRNVAPLQTVTIAVTTAVALNPGRYCVGVATSSDSILAQSPSFGVGAGLVLTGVGVTPTAAAGSAVDSWTVTFSPTGTLPATTTVLTLSAPHGTQWSTTAADYTVNGTAVAAAPVVNGPSVQITLPVALTATVSATIVAANVTNPPGGTLTLRLDAGGPATASAPFVIKQGATALQTAGGTLLGRSILVLPRFTPSNRATLGASVVSAAQGATADTLSLWIQQLTYVRPAIDRLDRASGIAQMLTPAQTPPSWIVLQQPYDPADVWIGTAASPAAVATPGRVAVVLQLPPTQTLAFNGVAGLYIDEWTERIPNAAETTALTFHYQEPTARAPQALLLAVNQSAEAWNWTSPPPASLPMSDNIIAVLKSTLDLAKTRAVDPLSLRDGAQYLPFIYIPTNLAGASTGAATPQAMQ